MPSHFLVTAAVFALCAAGPLHAAPDTPPGDAVVQLLHDKGLLPDAAQAESNAVVQQVRDAASDLVMSAMNFLGVRYRRGGNSVDQGFD